MYSAYILYLNIVPIPIRPKRIISKVQFLVSDPKDRFVCLFGFSVTLTQYRSYGDVPALLVKEDLRCPSVHYFRHKQAPE
jgi:hypothetical protein